MKKRMQMMLNKQCKLSFYSDMACSALCWCHCLRFQFNFLFAVKTDKKEDRRKREVKEQERRVKTSEHGRLQFKNNVFSAEH